MYNKLIKYLGQLYICSRIEGSFEMKRDSVDQPLGYWEIVQRIPFMIIYHRVMFPVMGGV